MCCGPFASGLFVNCEVNNSGSGTIVQLSAICLKYGLVQWLLCKIDC